MNGINTENLDYIGRYAKQSGEAFDRSRKLVCEALGSNFNVDLNDAFSRVHVTVARLLKEIEDEVHVPKGSTIDLVQTALTLIILNAVFISHQDTLKSYRDQIEPHLRGAPDRIIDMGVILAATDTIKRRQAELAQLTTVMGGNFMGNVCASARAS